MQKTIDGRGRHRNHAKGRRAGRWNSNRMTTQQGYVKLRVGMAHPCADANGYAYEHAVILAAIGQCIPENHVVHHANGDCADNRIENLQVLSREEHNRLHLAQRGRGPNGRFRGRTWDEYPARA